MPQAIALIVGLGNPGPEYADTRHNAGFRFLEAVAAGAGCVLRMESRFFGHAAKARIAQQEVWLLAPQTYMNNSGKSVAALAHYYKIPTESILVAHDELDVALGSVRLKQGGGAAGHNGVADVMEKLGAADFWRLRIGIGRPPVSDQVLDYVLKRASAPEQALIDAALQEALAHVDAIVRGDMPQAMTRLHAFSKDGQRLPENSHKKTK